MRRAFFVWVVVSMCGCECGTPLTPDGGMDAGSIDAGPSDAGATDAGPTVELSVTLDANFGAVLRGQFVERTGRITNLSTRALGLRSFNASGNAAFSVSGTETQLAPQGSVDFTVRFTAGTHGVITGSLDFLADGVPQHVALTAESIGPEARLMPMIIDLGQVPLYGGTTATGMAELGVENIGRDTTTHRADTELHVTFDVAQLDGDPATVCVNDCLPDALTVLVGGAISPSVRVNATSLGQRRFEVRVFSNDPTQPLLTVEVRFEVVARPLCQSRTTPVDFGVLNDREPRQLEVVFENVGTEACEITSAFTDTETPALPTSVFEVVQPQTFPIVVPPGGVQRSLVRATGQLSSAIQVTAPLKLEVNAPARYATATLTARLEQSPVVIGLTQALEFGDVAVGCSSRAIPLSTNAQALTVSTPSAAFQVAPSTAGVPTVRFTPTAAGETRDSLVVSWTENGMPRITTVELHGTGVTGAQRIEDFTPSASSVDVLFAIDDAPSMMPYASKITQQLMGLPAAFLPNNVDFHAAVVSCGDVTSRGQLRTTTTGQRFVTSATPMLATRFPELLTFTGLASGHSCKENVLRALTFPHVNTANAGFRRAGVPLVVVQITDTDDSDTVLSPQLLELAHQSAFTWNAIAPTTGNGQLTLTVPTGGVRTGIDAMDWSPSLVGIVQAAESRTRFVLAGKPDAQPVEVRVDGTAIPMGGSTWTYDAASNTIVFTAVAAPAVASAVRVTYSATCAP